MKSDARTCLPIDASNRYRNIVTSFERKRENLIPILHALQRQVGYLSERAVEEVAGWLDIPTSEVYGTATFYTLFSTEPRGRYVVRVCDSPSCHIEGSKAVKAAVERELGIRPGETTGDGNFTLEVVSCFGLCGVSPAMMIDEDAYGNLTPQIIGDILDRYRKKEA